MASIIYYANLDYDQLPTSRKKLRLSPDSPTPASSHLSCSSSVLLLSSSSSSAYATQTLLSQSTVRSDAIIDYYNSPRGRQQPPTSGGGSFQTAAQHYENTPPTSAAPYEYESPRQQSYTKPPAYTRPQQFPHRVNGPKRPLREKTAAAAASRQKTTWIDLGDDDDDDPPPPKYNTPPISIEQRRPLHHSPPEQFKASKSVDQKQLHDVLKRYFNFASFRENQLEAVNATCQGYDTLVLMPTGGGKSICYQLPAIVTDGLSIVVSPLKSLIDDQVTRLRSLRIKTSALMGDTSEAEVNNIFSDLRQPNPEHKLLYVTPEKITASQALISVFSDLYSRGLLARFVIDEAHCVSTWGADFRPDYRKLGRLRELFSGVPIMALTATAPPQVRDDIYNQLKMNKRTGKTFIQSFNRPNLQFEVRTKSKGCIGEICSLIKKKFPGQCGIIYCLSRNDCESVAEKLRDNSLMSAPYHAGLSDNQRKKVFKAWSTGTFQVVCATIAFGMGIDKSDVRFVIHYSVPKSVEGYYQEAGRAGRDGKDASCVLYFSKSDVYRMKSMLSKGFGKADDKKRDQNNLEHIVNYVENRNECRRAILLRYLGEEFNSNDCISHHKTACDNCLARKN